MAIEHGQYFPIIHTLDASNGTKKICGLWLETTPLEIADIFHAWYMIGATDVAWYIIDYNCTKIHD